jgi:hypothetical protein
MSLFWMVLKGASYRPCPTAILKISIYKVNNWNIGKKDIIFSRKAFCIRLDFAMSVLYETDKFIFTLLRRW